jgi:hypothetical protein
MASWIPSRQDAVDVLSKLLWGSVVLDTPLSLFRLPRDVSGIPGTGNLITSFVVIYVLSVLWTGQVTEIVPEPYLAC